MNDFARAIVVAAIVLGGALVVRGTFGTDRYDLVPAVGGAVYRLDRLTGGVAICTPAACRPLPTLVPAPGGPPAGAAPPRPAQPLGPASPTT